jgi:hypothetical protein
MGHCWKTDKFRLGKEPTLPTFMFTCQWPCHVEHTSSLARWEHLVLVAFIFSSLP